MSSVALYSGGVDSYGLSVLCDPDVLLYVRMGGRYGEVEYERLQTPPGMEDRLRVVDFRDLGTFEEDDSKVIPGRNAILALLASNYGNRIFMGSVDSSTGNDKDRKFAKLLNELNDHMFAPQRWLPKGRTVQLLLPIYHLTKTQLVGECLRSGAKGRDIADRTFSCYEPVGNQECGKCPPCGRKWAALTVWGIDVGFDGREAIRHYVDEMKDGRPSYRSKKFQKDIMDAWNGKRRRS